MTTEAPTTDIDSAIAWFEALKGASVQINHDCLDPISGNLHIWAGKHGTLTGANPFGAAMIAVGSHTKTFDRNEFAVTAPAGAAPVDPAPERLGAHDPAVRLVNVPPLEAINSTTNPRRRRGLDVDSLRALADSILAHGLGNPILVRPLPASRLEETSGMEPRPAYEVIAGERRWRAAQLADLNTMPMVVRHMDDQAVLEMQLVENIEREDLDPMEEAEGFALLRDKLGYSVEQIAERMGKGRGESYVRKRMKLLDLTPESREAMYEGTLMLSTGLLVAKYPGELQAKAVKIVKGMETRGSDGKPVPAPFRSVSLELHRKLNTTIKTAVFDTLDPGLILTAGPCSACPKRTRADEDLFSETTDAGDDSCLDSTCWEAKKTAHVQRARADAEARGLQIMDESEAARLLSSPYRTARNIMGYEPLTATAYTEMGNDGKEREVTYADALRAQGRKGPKPILVIHPHTSEAFEVIPDDVADRLRPQQGTGESAPKDRAAKPPMEDPRPPELRALRDSTVRRAVLLRAFDVIRTRERSVDDMRLIARNIWELEPELTEQYLGWSEEMEGLDHEDTTALRAEKINAMNADELAQAITMGALEYEVCSNLGGSQYSGDPSVAVAAVSLYGIDILAVAEKVAEDLERQKAATQGEDLGEGDPDEHSEEEGPEV